MGKVANSISKKRELAQVGKNSVDRTQSAIAERYKRAFLDVPHNGAFSAYGTIEKSPTCVFVLGGFPTFGRKLAVFSIPA